MTVEDIYKTKSKLYRGKGYPLLILTTGDWFPAITFDLEGPEGPQVSNGADLSGLMDSEELQHVEPAGEEEYKDFMKAIFDENIELLTLL